MAKQHGTAREHILATLTRHPDRELRLADLFEEAGGRFTTNNLQESLGRLLKEGRVVKTCDHDRSVWWALAVLAHHV
ncbi:MAG: hypothetical protein ACOYOB_20630 [Myxococcota bacterium]